MGVPAAISLDEYLRTSFPDLDREFRDGELVERSTPDCLHAKAQGLLFLFFSSLSERFHVYPSIETRMLLSARRALISDVAVFHPAAPPRIPDAPPLAAIEILSLDDRLTEVREKLDEYRAWGVPHVWLTDPYSRRLYTCEDRLNEAAILQIPELGIDVTPSDVFGKNTAG
ncbi:MAG: Uma2 family endonuclease [Acidobacteriota bacterium]